MASVPSFTHNDGTKIPAVGIGCWMGEPGHGDRAYTMVLTALKIGYRHIDTAAGYENEESVGRAIRDSGVPREEIYLVSKLPNSDHDRVKESFEKSLEALGTYLDLYLLHWPMASVGSKTLSPEESPTYLEAWKDMEPLLQTGKVKSIGVSNFSVKTLTNLLNNSTIVPANNQIELHPCLPNEELKALCDSKGILLTAYSPLGNSTVLHEDPEIKEIAERNSISTAQVVLSWAVQRGIIVIPKSENEGRLKQNLTLHHLTDGEMSQVSCLHKQPGKHRSLLGYHKIEGDVGSVIGWTYEQLGWNMKPGGVVA